MQYDPLTALSIMILIMAIILVIVWPEKGIWARLRKMMRNNQRILLEDALKYILDCERNQTTLSVKNVAGTLGINTDQATQLIGRLRDLALIEMTESGFNLTADGRDYALRIVRIHRLYEQYLAEKSGLPENAWHKEADRFEHHVSEDKISEIDHMLGYPRYDPHGDPIPTEKGDLPPSDGVSLTTLGLNESGVIIHIEDEPKTLYSEVIDNMVHVGMTVQIKEIAPESLTLLVEGNSVTLSRLAAENVSVQPVSNKQVVTETYDDLSVLELGEEAEVISISRACRGLQRRRLLDLGILPGTRIVAEMKSLGGDPTAFLIRGAKIALRRETAKLVQIRRLKEVA